MHLIALHQNASNNPMGVSSKMDRVPFYPYYVFKDIVGFFVFFLILSIFVFFFPNALGHWMAVLWSNSKYYDSTMCWNSFSLLDTWDVKVVPFPPVKIPQTLLRLPMPVEGKDLRANQQETKRCWKMLKTYSI